MIVLLHQAPSLNGFSILDISVIPALTPLGVVPIYEPDSALYSPDGHAHRTDGKNILPHEKKHSSRYLVY